MKTYERFDEHIEDVRQAADRLLRLKELGHGQGSTDQRTFARSLERMFRFVTGQDLEDALR